MMLLKGAVRVRFWLALWLGKFLALACRILRKRGSTFPGRIMLRVAPNWLQGVASGPACGNVIVSGTNGKTTTASMVADIMRQAGLRVVHNQSGANLLSGLVTAFAAQLNLLGRTRADIGLLEVDEATVPKAAAQLQPRALVVTNFFRDQLDRFGELAHVVACVRRGLPHISSLGRVVLNADDPWVASLGSDSPAQPLYYGIEADTLATMERHAADAKHCLQCGHPYTYRRLYYAHLGDYLCPSCGHGRPKPQVALKAMQRLDGQRQQLVIATPGGEIAFTLGIPGVYNIYNALAAIAGCLALGIDLTTIRDGLESFASCFGRMEEIMIEEKRLVLALVKNPVGFDEVIRTILASRQDGEEQGVLFAVNDLYADGEDISWLWDVDLEMLTPHQELLKGIFSTGLRREDMALRLKYAGFQPERIAVVDEFSAALGQALQVVPSGGTLYILPTYTAMLQIREILFRQGHVSQWQV